MNISTTVNIAVTLTSPFSKISPSVVVSFTSALIILCRNLRILVYVYYVCCLFVSLPLQPTVVVFPQPGSGL